MINNNNNSNNNIIYLINTFGIIIECPKIDYDNYIYKESLQIIGQK